MSAVLNPDIILADKTDQGGTLTITNSGDVPIKFRGRSSVMTKEAPDGINLMLPYGDKPTDLCSQTDIQSVSVTAKSKGWNANRVMISSGRALWDIYPSEDTVIQPKDSLIIKICSVKGNNKAGTVTFQMIFHTSSVGNSFSADWKKNMSPKITGFSAKFIENAVRQFIEPDTVASKQCEGFPLMPYVNPPPKPGPTPPRPIKKVHITWTTENASSCNLKYGTSSHDEPESGEVFWDPIDGVKEVTLTAYGEKQIGSETQTTIIAN